MRYTSTVKATAMNKMRASNKQLLRWLLLLTLVLGAIEGFYGRTRYSGDAINYLNMVRALHAGNWKLALNPYWGFGYPLLISLMTPLFPSNPSGEWIAIHAVNLSVLAATYFSFMYLVWTAARSRSLQWIVTDLRSERLLLIGSFLIFLAIELSMDNVSRVGPDMLVSCIVFACSSLLIKLQESANRGDAIRLGLLLGFGFVVKTIFLPLTLIFASLLVPFFWSRRSSMPKILLTLISAAVFAVPYVAGLSWALGHFTVGESGSLNYAWNVNKLEPGGLWQGYPPEFGKPIHPAQMLSDNPHIYLFDGPFPVTFGPFYNPPYYYQGYRHLFRLTALIHETGGNVLRLIRVVYVQVLLYALIICWLISRRQTKGSSSSRGVRSLWPLVVVSISGIGIYLLVYIEARYIASFLAMLSLVLLFDVVARASTTTRSASNLRVNSIFFWLLTLGCAGSLFATQKDADRNVIGHWMHHQTYLNDDQWKAGIYLQQMGIKPGDKVAEMTDLVSASRSTWAYMDHLQIIGLLGGSLSESETADFDAYWKADTQARAQMLAPFQAAGAKLILTKNKPDGVPSDGWEAVPGTAFWVYRF